MPEAQATTGTTSAVSASSAAAQALASAKQSGVQLLGDAQTGVEKLIAIAAGDAEALLTQAETAAIPVILHAIPSPYSAIVGPFAQAAASKAEGAINAAVDPLVTTGLGLAHNWLDAVIARATKAIENLGAKA